jgi:hypothetical protein
MNAALISAIVSLLGGVMSAVVNFFNWLHEQQLVQSGIAQAQLQSLKDQAHEAQIAIAAREAVRANIATKPDSVPVNDPFLRD